MKSFLPGDIVKVRSVEQILSTLDAGGTLDGLPFMPEMAKFCELEFQVFQRAQKFCIENGEMGNFTDVVFLRDVRCDGSAHRGCGRGCLIFWKEQWLERPAESASQIPHAQAAVTLKILEEKAFSGDIFFCQSTQLMHASNVLPWWKLRQYAEDIFIARVGIARLFKSLLLLFYNKTAERCGRPLRGAIHGNSSTQAVEILALQAGEFVRVKSLEEIRATLDGTGKNKGLIFTPEMAKFCGQTFRVRTPVERIILEHTPHMRAIRNTITLDGVWCDGICRRCCNRSSLYLWREAWVERAPNGSAE